MAVGQFNINNYIKNLEKLYEEQENTAEETKGNEKEGLIIPEINRKTYDWLKKEYHAGQTEVKVEMKMGGSKFEPGYEMQTDLKSVKDFKPGMYGDVKMGEDAKNNTPEGQKPPKGGLGGVKVKAATADDKKPVDAEKKEGKEDDKKKEKEEVDEKKVNEEIESKDKVWYFKTKTPNKWGKRKHPYGHIEATTEEKAYELLANEGIELLEPLLTRTDIAKHSLRVWPVPIIKRDKSHLENIKKWDHSPFK